MFVLFFVFAAVHGCFKNQRPERVQQMEEKLGGGRVDIRTYGATGDGITDDTQAIQKAMDSIPQGGTVFFPKGNYRITSGLTINHSNIHLLGEGGQNSKIFFQEYGAISETYGHGVIYADGKEYLKVEGLYVCGAGGPRSWESDFGIGLRGCSHSAIVNNIVENLAGAAMGISGTDPGHPAVNGLIQGNIVRNCHSDGISGQLNEGIRVLENYVTNTGEDSSNYPILLEWTHGSLIHGNVCDTSHNGIILNNTGDARAAIGTPSIISNNIVKNSKAYGIFLAGAYHTVVEGNTTWKTDGGGIFVHEPNWKHQDQGNLITGNICYGSGTGGIGCSQNQNTIKGNILVDNNMLNNQLDPLQGSGIVLMGGASHNVVEGNYIYNVQNEEEGKKTGYQKYGVTIGSVAEVENFVINNISQHLMADGQPVLDRGMDTVIIDLQAGSDSVGMKSLQPEAIETPQ